MKSLLIPSPPSQTITRRDVLKLAGLGAFSLFISPKRDFRALAEGQQGRIIDDGVGVFDIPSFSGVKISEYWKDMVVDITGVTIGDLEPAHNRVWYQVEDNGYAHSGAIQPVQTLLNPPVADLPPIGALAEVTVPFTDAHRGPGMNFPVAYRYYYATTHWILRLIYGDQGQPWYHVLEDKWDNEYYVPAPHLRIVPLEELTPISPDVPPVAKRMEVRTAEQIVIAYEWDQPVYMTRAATGARFSNGNFATPTGRHLTFHKRPSRHMAAGNLAFNGYDLPGVPWITYFTESGISFHGTFWHNNFGRPRSHGCVNLTPKAAKWIYRWTIPAVPPSIQEVFENYGTPVDVIDEPLA